VGTATGGEFLALLDPRSAAVANVPAKIVFAMTGTGPLHITAVGPDGRIISPSDGPTPHLASSWSPPGDEWGSIWLFPAAGCWHLHAVRNDITGDLWFNVTALQLRITGFAIRQRGRDRTTITSGVPAVFVIRTATNAPGLDVWITVRRGRKVYRRLWPILNTSRGPGMALVFRHSITFHQRTPASFSATAHVQLGHVTLIKRLHFWVSP
jgi:hypothetical protein